jgi:hypothetical protein
MHTLEMTSNIQVAYRLDVLYQGTYSVCRYSTLEAEKCSSTRWEWRQFAKGIVLIGIQAPP